MDAAFQRYGDVFNAPVIGRHPTVLFVSHPEALQQLFTSDTKQFVAPPNQLLQPLVGDRSIFVMQEQRHRRERRLLMPAFHGEHIQTYGQWVCELTEQAIATVPVGDTFSARELMQRISLEVILKVVFGIADGDSFARLKSLIVQFTDALQIPWIAGLLFFPSLQNDWGSRSPWGYLKSVQRQIIELLDAEISARRQHSTPNGRDVLSMLIAARDDQGAAMTNEELRDELITLLLAGHETTASAVAWALYWIHRDPYIRTKLLAELASLEADPSPSAIAQLPYLAAVCSETLRIYPVAVLTVPREVREPVNLMGYALEPGMRVYGCIYLTHRRPDLYPEAEQFRPERFLERQFSPYEFLPFGGGVRRCIGDVLALFEMKLVLATLLSRCELALADAAPEQPKRRGVTLAPANGVKMVLNRR